MSHSGDLSETIKQQRKLLVSKLGIDVGGAANLDTTHLFTDEDLLMSANVAIDTPINHHSTLVKRKLSSSKLSDDLESPAPTPHPVKLELKHEPDQLAHCKKIKSEEADPGLKEGAKPLELFVKWLLDKLVSPEWEVRHGASTTLREILKQITLSIEKFNLKSEAPARLSTFFEYCLYKLLTVIALDRFADYIGDEAVAPVRETCAQIIGILSSHLNMRQLDMNKLSCLCHILNTFIQQNDDANWEIRHSGIMALKYTIAASAALVDSLSNLKLIFQLTFTNILRCLTDNDDDVRHVASTALEPVSSLLAVLLNPAQIELLIKILIDVLTHKLDDLATSCSHIMSLLSDLLSTKSNSVIFMRLLNGESIIPHLITFFHHTSIQVKRTALITINKIILAIHVNYESNAIHEQFKFETVEKKENLSSLFRLLYQQAILLSSENAFVALEELIEQLWETLCHKLSVPYLINLCFPHITTWILLMMHSPSQPIDSIYLMSPADENSGSFNSAEHCREFIGSSQIKFEDKLTKDLIIVKCRRLAARMLAKLFYRIASTSINIVDASSNEKPINVIINFLCSQINFKSGIQRFCFALLMIEWGRLIVGNQLEISAQLTDKILTSLDDNTIYFDEIAILFTRLQKDTRNLINVLYKFDTKNLEAYAGLSVFTFEDVTHVCGLAKSLMNDPCKNIGKKLKLEIQVIIANLVELNQQTSQEQESLQIRSSSCLAAASIAIKCLSQRMNPLIRPLMDSIRFESNQDLQAVASKHLAILLVDCCKRSPNPIPKIFKNILTYLCNDPLKTPIIQKMSNLADPASIPDKEYYETNRYYGILSERVSTPLMPTTAAESPEETALQQANLFKLQIEKRGAELTLKSICEVYGGDIELIMPELIQAPLAHLEQLTELNRLQVESQSLVTNQDFSHILVKLIEACEVNLSKYHDLIHHLQLIEFLCACGQLDKRLFKEKFLQQITKLNLFIKSPLAGVRHLACRSIASMCSQEINESMELILEPLLDTLDSSEFNLFARQGALELIYCLCERLNELIIPFTVIFIVPILKRMCDLDWYVRNLASQCFALLIKLYPLGESQTGKDNQTQTIIRNPRVLRIKLEQQDFLDQLMDIRKLKPYELPYEVMIGVELRSYQQTGINWLAFLKKFNLHGKF